MNSKIKALRLKYRTKAMQQDEWIVSDSMGEYVEYYNPTGHVMVFTRDFAKARRTTDSHEAAEIARIARVVYKRPNMRFSIYLE